MNSVKLRAMIIASNKQYNLGIPTSHIDTILDLCDDNYELELNRVMEAQGRVNKVFITALGRDRFYEVKNEIEKKGGK